MSPVPSSESQSPPGSLYGLVTVMDFVVVFPIASLAVKVMTFTPTRIVSWDHSKLGGTY